MQALTQYLQWAVDGSFWRFGGSLLLLTIIAVVIGDVATSIANSAIAVIRATARRGN